jgi:hypothetical protein
LDGKSSPQTPGKEVIVCTHTHVAESKRVAEYYAQKAGEFRLPGFWIFAPPNRGYFPGLIFESCLQKPLAETLKAKKLGILVPALSPSEPNYLIIHPAPRTRGSDQGFVIWFLCYGVPVRILRDENLKEAAGEQIREELRRKRRLPSIVNWPFYHCMSRKFTIGSGRYLTQITQLQMRLP